MVDILKAFAPRAVQDLITAFAGYLAAHGFLTAGSQEQGFIGSAFFLAMLIINYAISHSRQANAAIAGANTVGASISSTQASAIAKTGNPQ